MRHSTYVEVYLRNIAHNLDCVRRIAGKTEIIPMIKGNAYGHGVRRVSQYLHSACGIRNFGVASLGEALAICGSVPCIKDDPRSEIFIFSDTEVLNEGCQSYYQRDTQRKARLTPILGTVREVKTFCGSDAFKHSKLCLKINTGMNRLGISHGELEGIVPLLRQRGGVDLLLQHFGVSGSVKRLDETHAQYGAFKKAKQFLLDSAVEVRATSVSNSGAVEQGIGLDETYIRPGIMLYGPRSVTTKSLWCGKQASYFYTKVLNHFPLKKGDGVGYDLTPMKSDGVVLTLPIGYADGFFREYTGMPITVTAEDPSEPIVGTVHGRVNMDMMSVAVYPEEVGKDIGTIMAAVKDESRVCVWGEDIEQKAASVGTIPYQLMCGISIRVPMIYK